MSALKAVTRELKSIAATTLYFAIVFIFFMVLKKLFLKDYDINFNGLSAALIGALILAKVILLMKSISFGSRVKSQPSIVDVILRTLLYTIGVAVVLVLEKAFESRHESDGFGNAVLHVIRHRDFYIVWATILMVSVSILIYNMFSILEMYIGKHQFRKLFFKTPLQNIKGTQTRTATAI